MKILVAIPVYDSKLSIEVVGCLLNEQALAGLNGDVMETIFLPNCSHPAMGRNQLAKAFMESDCERLVFLDSDVTFELGNLLKLAHHKADFVGGAYRFKQTEEFYPVTFLPGERWTDANGLMEVETLPAGFLALSKNVFQKMRETFPEKEFTHFGHKLFVYFEMPFKKGVLSGEDSFFCQTWRDIGGKVYLDPEIALIHWDIKPSPFKGHVGNWLINYGKEASK